MSGPSSKTTTKSDIPEWVSKAGETNYGKATDLFNKPYNPPPTPDQRVAGFNSDQNNAFSQLRDYVSSGGGANGALFKQGTDLISDPSKGLNPYTDAVLQPQIREIGRVADASRMSLGDSAQSAGAFGDARQGVLEGEVGRNQMQQVGDATGAAYKSAYDAAAARGGQLVSASSTGQNDFMSRLSALLGVGNTEQQNDQSKKDVNFQNYQAAEQAPYDKLNALVGTLSGTPYNKATTSTTTSNPGISPFATLLGAFLGA